MKKIIFLEGLPSVGKTYLVNTIKNKHLPGVHVVDELINPDINDPYTDSEDIFLRNDEMKVNKYKDGLIIIDRGPISTLVYNQVLHCIDNDYNPKEVEDWFKQFLDIYASKDTKTIYLNNPGVYNPSIDDYNHPFGSIENLKLTHTLTLYNLNKYAKNVKVIEYNKENIVEVLDEIIN